MITGAVAVIIYGEPRLTQGIDLVIELRIDDLQDFRKMFPSEEFYCPPEEVLKLEVMRPLRGHFNIIHLETGFKADCYTMGQDELHRWGMVNRKELSFVGESIWVAAPEYVILRKLEYYREGKSDKHLRDIATILSASSEKIDSEQLRDKIRILGLKKEWTKAKEMKE